MRLLGSEVSTYDEFMSLPVGTGIVCSNGYWRGRRYVKTTENTWARVFHADWREQVDEAVRVRRISVSPAPLGNTFRVVLVPKGA